MVTQQSARRARIGDVPRGLQLDRSVRARRVRAVVPSHIHVGLEPDRALVVQHRHHATIATHPALRGDVAIERDRPCRPRNVMDEHLSTRPGRVARGRDRARRRRRDRVSGLQYHRATTSSRRRRRGHNRLAHIQRVRGPRARTDRHRPTHRRDARHRAQSRTQARDRTHRAHSYPVRIRVGQARSP